MFDAVDAVLAAYATNNRINEYMIRNLPAEVWRMKSSGGKGRDIASIVAHMHNVRLMWLKAATKGTALPAKLEGSDFGPSEAIDSLAASHQAIHELLASSLKSDGRIKGFKPDASSFFGYLIAHDAHHRGQVSMLARQLGHPLPQSAMYGMWEWGTR